MPELSIQEINKSLMAQLSKAQNRGGFSRADMDEIAMLTTACKSILPERFITVVNNMDASFNRGSEAQLSFLERLLRISNVATKLPVSVDRNDSSSLTPTFTLNKKDRDRVIKLCGDMRKIVFASSDFDDPHKKRLLNRIAAIEKQVLSKRGLFDVVLGGVSDIGETLGKFGKDIKPLTDRMNEVAKITRQGTKEYDQIPALEEIKRLPKPDDNEAE